VIVRRSRARRAGFGYADEDLSNYDGANLGAYDRTITIDTAIPASALSPTGGSQAETVVVGGQATPAAPAPITLTALESPPARAPLWPWLVAAGALALLWYYSQREGRRGDGPLDE
jgi:hypothetical protein